MRNNAARRWGRGRRSFTRSCVDAAPVKGRKDGAMDELPNREGKDLRAHWGTCERHLGVRCGRGHLKRVTLSWSMFLSCSITQRSSCSFIPKRQTQFPLCQSRLASLNQEQQPSPASPRYWERRWIKGCSKKHSKIDI